MASLTWRTYGNKQWCTCPYQFLDKEYPWTQKVGYIKKKNDGRWSFWLYPRGTHARILAEKMVEGVVATEEEARKKVESNYA